MQNWKWKAWSILSSESSHVYLGTCIWRVLEMILSPFFFSRSLSNYVDAWTCVYTHSSKVKGNLMQMSHPLNPLIKSWNSWHEVMMGIWPDSPRVSLAPRICDCSILWVTSSHWVLTSIAIKVPFEYRAWSFRIINFQNIQQLTVVLTSHVHIVRTVTIVVIHHHKYHHHHTWTHSYTHTHTHAHTHSPIYT